MRFKHTTLWIAVSLVLTALTIALFLWHNTSLRFILAEKAVLSGQSITIPINHDQLTDLSKDSASENAGVPAAPLVTHTPIAILLTGLGVDEAVTQQALQLPDAVALGFSPYVPSLPQWENLSRTHPVLIAIPAATQPLHTGVEELENTAHMEWLLSRFSEYAGVYTPADAKTLLALKNIRPFLDSLKARNLLFVYGSNNTANNELQQLAESIALTTLDGGKIIDAHDSDAAILAHLAEIEVSAKENNHALLVVNASIPVIQALSNWIPTLAAKGLRIAPITDIVRKIE